MPALSPAMPNTFTSLHYHVFFSTKNRELWISKEWRERFWEYLGGAIRGLGGHPHQIRGVVDHVHLALGLKPTHSVSKVLQELKKASSHGFIMNSGSQALHGRTVTRRSR